MRLPLRLPAATAHATAQATRKRNAREIFDAGLENLKAEPTAWFFGPPSALYSNEPPPAVPPPAGAVALCSALCSALCAMQCTTALILGPAAQGAGCITLCITPRTTPCISPHAPLAARRGGYACLHRSAHCAGNCTRAGCHQLRDCPAAAGCRDRSPSSAAGCGARGGQGQEEQIHQARGEEAQGPRDEGHEELAWPQTGHVRIAALRYCRRHCIGHRTSDKT